MKYKWIHISLFIIFCFISCEKEEPDEDNKPENISEKTAVFDQSGGTLALSGFELRIPKDAFTSETELTVSLLDEQSEFSEDSNSSIYLVEGLPAFIQKPLRIKIQYTGNLSEQNFIAAGEEAMHISTGEEDIYYDFLQATDSSGYLIAEYDASPGNKKALLESQDKKWIKIQVVSNYLSEMKVAGGEKYTYDLYLRKNVADFKPELIGFFDKAYQVFLTDLKFTYSFYFPLIGTPMNNILVTNLSEDVYCKYIWKLTNPYKPAGKFVINARKMDDMEKMGLMIAKEVFRSILFQHNRSFPESTKPEMNPDTWLNQALITWSEEFLVTDKGSENFVPSEFPGNELKPLVGIDYGKNTGEGTTLSNLMDYGDGMAAVLKFLSTDYVSFRNDTILSYFYEKAHEGEFLDPATILLGVMNEVYKKIYDYVYLEFVNNTQDYWYEFLNDYLMGNVYAVAPSVFLNSINSERTFLIGSESDTLNIFADDYPELSAHLYKIEFQNQEIKENGALELSLKGNHTDKALIMVYAIENGKLKRLGFGNKVNLSEFSAYQTLLVAVGYDYFTDNHDTYSTFELEVRYRQKRALPYIFCTISTSVYRIRESNKLVDPNPEETVVDTVLWNVKWYLKGEFTDYTFEGTIDAEKQGGSEKISGGVIVKLDADLQIIELHVNAHFKEETYSSTWGLDSNQKLALGEDLGFMLKYDALENAACNYIDFITGYYENFDSYDKTLDFYCGDISEFRVKFSLE